MQSLFVAGSLAALIGGGLLTADLQAVHRFCRSVTVGDPTTELAEQATRAGLATWTLSETVYKGRTQWPILVAERGPFVCLLTVRRGEVIRVGKRFRYHFERRYPRRIAMERAKLR